jgi:hypothetical protein
MGVDEGLSQIYLSWRLVTYISEMQALSSFWRIMWRIIFYVALLRTQHWLEHDGQALLASLPWVVREQLPKWRETLQQAQELVQQMRPSLEALTETRETNVAMSESIARLLTHVRPEQMRKGYIHEDT